MLYASLIVHVERGLRLALFVLALVTLLTKRASGVKLAIELMFVFHLAGVLVLLSVDMIATGTILYLTNV